MSYGDADTDRLMLGAPDLCCSTPTSFAAVLREWMEIAVKPQLRSKQLLRNMCFCVPQLSKCILKSNRTLLRAKYYPEHLCKIDVKAVHETILEVMQFVFKAASRHESKSCIGWIPPHTAPFPMQQPVCSGLRGEWRSHHRGTHNICERKRAATWTLILPLRESSPPYCHTGLTIKAPQPEDSAPIGGVGFAVMKQRQSKRSEWGMFLLCLRPLSVGILHWEEEVSGFTFTNSSFHTTVRRRVHEGDLKRAHQQSLGLQ